MSRTNSHAPHWVQIARLGPAYKQAWHSRRCEHNRYGGDEPCTLPVDGSGRPWHRGWSTDCQWVEIDYRDLTWPGDGDKGGAASRYWRARRHGEKQALRDIARDPETWEDAVFDGDQRHSVTWWW